MHEIQTPEEALSLYHRALHHEDLSTFVEPLVRAFLQGIHYADHALTAIGEPARNTLEQHPKNPRASRRYYDGDFIGTDEEKANARIALLLLRLHLIKIPELRFTWNDGETNMMHGSIWWTAQKRGVQQSFQEFLEHGPPFSNVPEHITQSISTLFDGRARHAQANAKQYLLERLSAANPSGCESCGHLPDYFYCYEKDGDPWFPAGWAMEGVSGDSTSMLMTCRLCGAAFSYYYTAGDLGMDPYTTLRRVSYEEAKKSIESSRSFIP